jgi:RNA polymerase-binding transcription factor DksA
MGSKKCNKCKKTKNIKEFWSEANKKQCTTCLFCRSKHKCECGKKIPSFGFTTDKTARYCNECKKDDMVDIKNKKCECGKKRPCFGSTTDKTARYCNECKKDDMVNIKDKKCECGKKIPSFGSTTDKTARYCNECKKDDMVNIKHKKCECGKKRPCFGSTTDKTARYCNECKKDDMVNIKDKKCECGKKIPSFGSTTDKTARYCNECKKDDMVNIKDKKCESEHCDTQIKKKYKGYCFHCFQNIYPDEPLSRNYKTKENIVTRFVRDSFPKYKWSVDKIIAGGCSKRRPDMLVDFLTHSCIIEIDEDSHKGYSCENKRLMELFRDLGNRFLYVIRFNPDKYINSVGNVNKSCFVTRKTGRLEISNKKQLDIRLNVLKNTILEVSLNKEPEKGKDVTIIPLFFDDYKI